MYQKKSSPTIHINSDGGLTPPSLFTKYLQFLLIRSSLFKKLLGIILIIIFFLLAATYFTATFISLHHIKKRLSNQMKIAGYSIKNYIDARCSLAREFAQIFSKDQEIVVATYYADLAGERKKLYMMMYDRYKKMNIDIIEVVNDRGIVVVNVSNYEEYEEVKSNHPLLKKALNRNDAAADLIEDEYFGPVIAAAAPIIDSGGDLLGAVFVGYRIDCNFCKLLKDITGVDIFISDDKGSFCTTLEGIKSPSIKDVLQRKEGDLPTLAVGKKKYYTYHSTLKDKSQNDIAVLGVATDLKEAAKMKLEIARTIFVTITLILLMAGIFAMRFIRTLTGPINILAEKTRRIAIGKFEQSVFINSKDEFELLEERFNFMAKSLNDRQVKLEQSEKELTQASEELEKKNRELKTMQKQLIQSEKMSTLGTIAKGLAHEMNTPLGTVLLNTEMLMQGEMSGVKRECLDLILNSYIRGRDVLKQLIEYSYVPISELGKVSISQLVDDVCTLLSNDLIKNHIHLRKKYTSVPDIVLCNASELSHVFINIIVNARDAIIQTYSEDKTDGVIEVKTERKDNLVSVIITDDGIGMAPEVREKIFDPFFTTKEVGKGTGLGLSVTLGIVKKYKGNINVSSQQGKGTVFIIELPAIEG